MSYSLRYTVISQFGSHYHVDSSLRISFAAHFEEVSGPTLTVALLPLSNKIAFMEMSQRFHLEHLPKVLERALNGCRKIKAVMEKAVHKHLMQMGSGDCGLE
uniref:Uncharacterized protein n=1 Tax=Glossina pallidipes TaxID=7398 RepID=A0A1B0A4K6_GLOPL